MKSHEFAFLSTRWLQSNETGLLLFLFLQLGYLQGQALLHHLRECLTHSPVLQRRSAEVGQLVFLRIINYLLISYIRRQIALAAYQEHLCFCVDGFNLLDRLMNAFEGFFVVDGEAKANSLCIYVVILLHL